MWTALQPIVYRHIISDVDQLKYVLIDCLTQLSQNTLNRMINQLPKRLMLAKGTHVKFSLDKFCVQMIVAVIFTVFSC